MVAAAVSDSTVRKCSFLAEQFYHRPNAAAAAAAASSLSV